MPLFVTGPWCDLFPGPRPDQEEDQGPQNADGEGQEELRQNGEAAREATEERDGAETGGQRGCGRVR